MQFIDLAKKRYATKKYNKDYIIDKDKIEDLKEILRLCPSSINAQPWRFYFVTDEVVKAKLATVSLHNEHKIKDCNLLIVFTVQHDLADFGNFVKEQLGEVATEKFKVAQQNLSTEQIIGWMTHQVYIALGFCLSACISMDLDATPMEGIEHLPYKAILNSGTYFPQFAVAVGQHDTDDFNHPSVKPKTRRNQEDVIISIE
ncbi:MAG: nitroreductase family protein [Chitinophagales bacterium]|nr:nitroreductase family protein [Chitinophagales bacterium]